MKNIFFGLLVIFSLFISCSKKKTITTSDDFLNREPLGELTAKNLKEVSGMAASIKNPDYLWVHNDSGNDPEVYLIDTLAALKLTVRLKGIKNRDWEDITVGPGPITGKSYIYIADVGDNFERHTFKYIYRFEEPELTTGIDKIEITAIDTIIFKLPGSKKDTEALLLDPETKDLYVISKREEPVHVYKLKYPYNINDTITASLVTSLPLTQITAGAFSPNGKELLLKNYEYVYYWKINNHVTLEQALKETPQVLAYKQEPQGEAITWARDGSGYYTLTEKLIGEKCVLYFFRRVRKSEQSGGQ